MYQTFTNPQTHSATILAYEMPDRSMHPRIFKGDFAILNQVVDLKGEINNEIVVRFETAEWSLRTLVDCSDCAITLAAYGLPGVDITFEYWRVTGLYRVDMIVPRETLNLMVNWPAGDRSANATEAEADRA